MSQYGKLMLGAIFAIELAYIFFFLLMTDNFSLGQREPAFIGFAVLGFLAVVTTVLILQQLFNKKTQRVVPDEREEVVDLKSERFGGRILDAGVFILIALSIFEAFKGPDTLGSYSLTRPEALVFALITISSLAAITRLLFAFIQDQRA